MPLQRLIPILLIKQNGLYKSKKFKNFTYLGDPINAVKIFNEKMVDEICIFDIEAYSRGINYSLIEEIATEAFMPVSYGGGIKNLIQVEELFKIGVDKICLNSGIEKSFVNKLILKYGSQSIAAVIDYKKNFLFKDRVYINNGTKLKNIEIFDYFKLLENMGFGEIILQSIERDGMFKGLDIELAKKINKISKVPITLVGGANSIHNIQTGLDTGISGIGVGSYFVFNKNNRNSILINYPNQNEIVRNNI